MLLASWPVAGFAHGFAVRYDLPLPLGFFLAGAGAVVVLSFVVLALFSGPAAADADHRPAQRDSPLLGRILSRDRVILTLRLGAVGLYVLVVACALFGSENPYKNFSTTFVWVIWWVGMMLVNTFVGDLWALVNPWGAAFAFAERILRSLIPGARLSLTRPFPARLGVWPAVVLFLAFAWLELIWGEGEDPRKLAFVVIAYSLITWSAMFVFGRSVWLAHGEAFAVVFTVFARFAPVAFRVAGLGGVAFCPHGVEVADGKCTGCAACFEASPPAGRAIVLRLPGAGLLARAPVSTSMTALILVLLASVTFDGLFATPLWTGMYEFLIAFSARAPWLPEAWKFHIIATLALLLLPVVFAAAFLVCCRASAAIDGEAAATMVARQFVLTLLPIAIAYHFAHYLLYLLLTGQYIIPALSDPFGFGWNLFGTAAFQPDIGLVGAKFSWYTGVVAIVVGHVIAVYLADRTAQRIFHNRKRILASQLPTLVLMVAYTMISLWIIAQPAVR